MTLENLTSFFMWCAIINLVILMSTTLMAIRCSDWMYKVHSKWFDIPRQTYDSLLFGYLAVYKIVFIVFVLAPYLALLAIN